VQLRREHAERGLQPLDEVVALVVRNVERRLDGGAQILGGLLGFLEREVFGLRALVHALDQLIDAGHLLAERLLGGRLPGFRARADGGLGGREALLDRVVETFRLLPQRPPFARDRVPGIRRTVVLRRQLLGFL
jgi:hypothetical protein